MQAVKAASTSVARGAFRWQQGHNPNQSIAKNAYRNTMTRIFAEPFRIVLVCLLLPLLAACATPAVQADRQSVSFLHLNDTYRIDPVEDGNRGGFGRVVTLIRDLLDANQAVRVLHGGDYLYPSLESQLWDGEQMIEALNFIHDLAPLIAVPGNHEFDPRTPDSTVNALRQSRLTWLADNLELKTGAPDVDQKLQGAFVEDIDGLRIGYFGLTLHPDDGGNVRDYAPVTGNYLQTAERAIVELERQNADLIIGVTHLHLDDDRRVAALKRSHPTFQLIVGGHEHEPEFEPGSATSAMIVKGASNARTIWRIDAEREVDGQLGIRAERIAVDTSIEIDTEYRELSDRWRARLLQRIPYLEAKIGVAGVPLDGRETAVRNEESNWGSFIADQMRTAFGRPSDLAFLNSGTLRIDDYILGDITFEDVGRTFGFSSYLRLMTITGAEFRKLLEKGYRGTGPSKGYFPQVSGFRVCVDRRRAEGSRIVSLQVPGETGWMEIEAARDYSLVAPAFLYRGGDGYDFSAARNVSPPGSELKYLVVDAIVRAQAEGQTIGWEISDENRRIEILDEGNRRCWL